MAEQKDRVAFVKTISTKFGPMDKVSIELNKIGQVVEKEGKTYLVLPSDHKALNKYEKDGAAPRWFLNFNLNRFASMSLDEYVPENNSGGQNQSGSSDEVDDLPF